MTAPNQDTVEKVHAYETSIVELYDDDAERTLAREAAAEAEEISIDEWNRIVGAEGDPTKTETDTDTGDPEKPEGDEGTETGKTDTGEPDKTQTGDEGGDKEPTEAEKALAQERDEAIARAEKLERQEALRQSEARIREDVSKELQGKIDEVNRLNEADDKKLRDFEEEHGEDAAKVLRESIEANKQARQAELDRWRDDEVAKKTGHAERQLSAAEQIQADVDAVPELKTWQADSVAANAGDTSKSAAPFQLAVSIDKALRENDAWKGKPQRERFAEVVKMVKASGSAPSSGSPSAQEKSKETDEEIARKLAAADAKDNKATGLSTLSDIASGDAAQTEARLENLSATELRDAVDSGSLSDAALEKAAAKLLED